MMRILIVDDSAMMRSMIKRVLRLTDIAIDEILEASNGAEALTVLQAHDVQLLLTDINMPVMTGAELLRELAGRERWRNLERIVISTDGSTWRRTEAEELEVRRYLEKPFTPEVLRDVLSGIVAANRS